MFQNNNIDKVNKVAVIGSGVMGAGLAALAANSGHQVILLDIVAQDSIDRNSLLKNALEKMQNQKPALLTHPSKLEFITIGNLEDNLELLKDCNLVIEAIIEKIEYKTELYNKISSYLGPQAIIASNTSTLQLQLLKQNLPQDLKDRFLIIHFFNPPRYMELVELITDKDTKSDVIAKVNEFLTIELGKTVVKCNDTPGFIANRLGCFLLELVVRKAIIGKLNPAIIDHIFTNLLKLPKTGVFGLYDLIGHDVMHLIATSLINSLPENDKWNEIYAPVPLLDKMCAENIIGRKVGQGFYRHNQKDKKIKEVISFADNSKISYEKIVIDEEFSSIESLLIGSGEYELFFQKILIEFYNYLFSLIPSVTDNINDIDIAIKLGYNWQYGPYELFEKYVKPIGLKLHNYSNKVLLQLSSEGGITKTQSNTDKFYRSKINQSNLTNDCDDHVFKKILKRVQDDSGWVQNDLGYAHDDRGCMRDELDSAHDDFSELSIDILSNNSATLHHYKNLLIFSVKTKMNVLNGEVFTLLESSIDYAEKQNKDLIIYPAGNNFSAGLDLKWLAANIQDRKFDIMDKFLAQGQKVMQRLKYAKVNIITCAKGFALGGGTELLLHSDLVIAHSELNAGLVEVNIGLLPSFGGMKEAFLKADNKEKLVRNIKNILLANKSLSADYFIKDYDIKNSRIVMNKSYLLYETIKTELPSKLPKNQNHKIQIPAMDLQDEIDISSFNDIQLYLIKKFQEIIDHRKLREDELLKLEREYFLELCQNPKIMNYLTPYIKS